MLPHPGFEIPDAFLQTGVRRSEVNVRRPQLSNGCLQGGYHGWHHSTERAAKPTRHPTPVNGYGLDLFAYLAEVCTASMADLAVPQLLPATA